MSFDHLRTDLDDIIFLDEEIASCWSTVLDHFWREIFDDDDIICELRDTTSVDS